MKRLSNTRRKTNAKRPNINSTKSVNLKVLDFDFEKICSVTASKINIFCCLSCGKYLRGRSQESPAIIHSLDELHPFYLNFSNSKIYQFPENKEVSSSTGNIEIDAILKDIEFAANPRFTKSELIKFPQLSYTLVNKPYYNGFVGWNDKNKIASIVATITLALSHCEPLRNYFLLSDKTMNSDVSLNPLKSRFNEIVRKIWSPKLPKSHISFTALLDYLELENIHLGSPKDFLLYLIGNFSLNSESTKLRHILRDNMRGKINAEVFETSNNQEISKSKIQPKSIPFWLLSLDLPHMPLIKGGINAENIPKVKFAELLEKFNGKKLSIQNDGSSRIYTLEKLPEYLIIHYNRIDTSSSFPIKDRNQTFVNYPLVMSLLGRKYSLISNIVLDVDKSKKQQLNRDLDLNWIIQIKNEKLGKWFEINGKAVQEKDRELLFLGETYLQIWKSS